jgi:uncharacterized membrane protein
MADAVYPCEDCGRIYNHTVLKRCPGCAANVAVDTAPRKTTASSNVTYKSSEAPQQQYVNDDRVATLLETLITETRRNNASINKTTFAVRAMVSYTVITVIAVLIAAVLVGLMALGGGGPVSVFFAIIGGLVLIGGTIYALATLIREWALSDVSRR